LGKSEAVVPAAVFDDELTGFTEKFIARYPRRLPRGILTFPATFFPGWTRYNVVHEPMIIILI
jgi:hypothetical protein